MNSNPILQKISTLRTKLFQWVLVRGMGQWLLIVVGVLICDIAIDRLFKMDFAQRLVMLALIGLALAAGLFWKVLRPLWLRPSDEALLYEVERKHPELKESLLSALQLVKQREGTDATTGVSNELVDATIRQGFDDAENIDFGTALNANQQKINWGLLTTGALLACVIGVGVLSSSFLNTWFRRNVLLTNDQWPQETYLQIVGADDGTLTISRGSDHRQLVMVSDGSSVTDVSVSLEIENPTGRSVMPMKRTGKPDGREHIFMFHNVSSKFRMRASGGDDVTEWVDVQLVEPPSIEKLTVAALLPEYTGVESEELAGPGPFSVLRNSKLKFDLTANKSIADALVLNGANSTALATVGDDKNQSFRGLVPESGGLQGGEYEVRIKSNDGVENSRKTKFTVTIKEDKPPTVRASLLGISGLIVPRATIPVSFQAADEYGLEKLGFNCGWKTEIEEKEVVVSDRAIEIATAGSAGLLSKATAQVNDVVALEMKPFDLLPGTSFRFSVVGKDFYPDAENVGRSQEFLLRVVTEAELRSDLLRREIEQRQAFDQAYQAQLLLTTELQTIVLNKRSDDQSEQEFIASQEQALIAATREQKSIGTRVVRIADRFEDFLVEVKNNKLDEAENEVAPEQKIETRFDLRIIRPIRKMDENSIALAARHMEHCRSLASDPSGMEKAAAQAQVAQQEIMEQMKLILAAMNDSESFQEIINQIISIRNANDELIKRIDSDGKPDEGKIDEESIFD
jgi:hypothetical protein